MLALPFTVSYVRQSFSGVSTYLSGIVVDPEGPADVAVLRFEQFPVLLVLDLDLLDVGLGKSSNRALDVQHAQETSALERLNNVIGISFHIKVSLGPLLTLGRNWVNE